MPLIGIELIVVSAIPIFSCRINVCGLAPNLAHLAILLCSGSSIVIEIQSEDERQPSPGTRSKVTTAKPRDQVLRVDGFVRHCISEPCSLSAPTIL